MQFTLVAILVVSLQCATDYPSKWCLRRTITLQNDPLANVQAMWCRQQRNSMICHYRIPVQRCSRTAKCVYGDWLGARQGAKRIGKPNW